MFTSHTRTCLALAFCALTLGCEKMPAPVSSLEVAVQGMHAAALDTHGEYALAASIYHGGSLWRLSDNERLFDWNHQPQVYSTIIAADFDSSQDWVITAEPNTMVLWNRRSGEAERFWTAPGEILDVALGPNARFALLGLDQHEALVFDVLNGGIKQTLVHQNRVRSVDLSANGKIAVTGSEDYAARTWDVSSGKILQTFKHEDDVQLVKLSDDGSLVLSMSKYDKAVVWRSRTGEKLGEIPLAAEHLKRGLRFTAARFSADQRFLLTGRPDQWVELWSLENFQKLASWEVPKREKWKPTSAAILDVAFSASEGEYVVAASNGFIHRLRLSKEAN